MHTITLKADDNFFTTLNELVSKLGTSRNNLIRNAVINYKFRVLKSLNNLLSIFITAYPAKEASQ